MTNSDLKKTVNTNFKNIGDNFKLKESIFYKIPALDFLIGFCFEKSKNENDSLYVWSFIQPLYVPNDSISLSFGRRLNDKLWKLKGINSSKEELAELHALMVNENDNFFEQVDSVKKFYDHFENSGKNLRMIEALVYSAIYSQNVDAEMIIDNFISTLRKENLSIAWIGKILEQMEYLKSIIADKELLENLFNKNIEYTKRNLHID
ncbi:hypothetical protein [Pedobacter sp.]|uniref:hypothetical protein n=1 Tax=Pedobacter sp. TaxID=1411316 RepID=UPI00396C3DB5